jgi:hypothetical protein
MCFSTLPSTTRRVVVKHQPAPFDLLRIRDLQLNRRTYTCSYSNDRAKLVRTPSGCFIRRRIQRPVSLRCQSRKVSTTVKIRTGWIKRVSKRQGFGLASVRSNDFDSVSETWEISRAPESTCFAIGSIVDQVRLRFSGNSIGIQLHG